MSDIGQGIGQAMVVFMALALVVVLALLGIAFGIGYWVAQP